MTILYTFSAFILSIAAPCAALVARASLPPSFSVQELGFSTEFISTFDGVSRDGGGGGLVNGEHLIVFSDTMTTNSDDQIIGFNSNSVAYLDANTPTSLTDFGSNGIPYLGIPFTANESAWTAANSGSRMIIWPGSAIAPMPDGVSGVAVYNVAELASNGDATALYSTMVKYEPNSSGPQATRAVPQLFYDGETNYGSFCSAISNIDGALLLFASATSAGQYSDGLKVARVNPDDSTDRTKYTYWDGREWSSTPVSPDSSDGNVFNSSLSSGDLFFNPYLNTWIAIYFDDFVDNIFWLRYSKDGMVHTGQWSDQIQLFETTPYSSSKYNYAGHAYPGYDTTGKTVLLSWTYDGSQTAMATVTFA